MHKRWSHLAWYCILPCVITTVMLSLAASLNLQQCLRTRFVATDILAAWFLSAHSPHWCFLRYNLTKESNRSLLFSVRLPTQQQLLMLSQFLAVVLTWECKVCYMHFPFMLYSRQQTPDLKLLLFNTRNWTRDVCLGKTNDKLPTHSVQYCWIHNHLDICVVNSSCYYHLIHS